MAASLLAAMVLTAAAAEGAQTSSPAAEAPRTITKQDSPQPDSVRGLSLLQAAREFSSAKYRQASDDYRQLLAQDSHNQTLWGRYNKAVLAAAGNDYLQALTKTKDRFRINVADFVREQKKGPDNSFLLDIREPGEFAHGNIPGSVNIPFRMIMHHLGKLPLPQSNQKLVIICQTQHRANHVLVTLRELGYNNAYTLRGGYSAYLSYQRKFRFGTPGRKKAEKQKGASVAQQNVTSKGITVIPLNKDAASALTSARPELALEILQNALQQEIGNAILWQQYNRALLIWAGEQYLCSVPDDRYRIDINEFVDLFKRHKRRFALIDVRDPAEFSKNHIKGSINLPLATLLQNLKRLPESKSSQTLLLLSNHQRRAIHALVVLREIGFNNVYTLHGGIKALKKWLRHLPTIQGNSSPNQAGKQADESLDDEEEEDWGC